jgi:hypothetical protein
VAASARIAGPAAGAGIHRRDQLEARRELGLARCARHRHLAGFERLAQHLEHAAVPFRHLAFVNGLPRILSRPHAPGAVRGRVGGSGWRDLPNKAASTAYAIEAKVRNLVQLVRIANQMRYGCGSRSTDLIAATARQDRAAIAPWACSQGSGDGFIPGDFWRAHYLPCPRSVPSWQAHICRGTRASFPGSEAPLQAERPPIPGKLQWRMKLAPR